LLAHIKWIYFKVEIIGIQGKGNEWLQRCCLFYENLFIFVLNYFNML
jgi:hypothetical protein